MPMLYSIGGILFHLREHIPHHLRIVTGPSSPIVLSPRVAHNSDEAQLRPAQRMVKVIFQKVILGQVGDVAGLDGGEEGDVARVGGERKDVDHDDG